MALDRARGGQSPLTLLGDAADTPIVGRRDGDQRLIGLLLFLGNCGEGDLSKLPKVMPYDPPTDASVPPEVATLVGLWSGWKAYAPLRPDPPVARVVWRDGIEEHMLLFWEMPDAEGEAMRLRILGYEEVSIERLEDDDGLSSGYYRDRRGIR
jgi:hypothetical protein